MNLRRRLLIEWALIALFGTLAVILATHWRGTSAFDNLVYDQLSSISRPKPDNKILLINIDEASLARVGKWPWNRNIHAQLIDKLASAGPRTILLDVLMSEASSAADDRALVEAMQKSGAVYLPLNFHSPGSDGKAYDTEYPLSVLDAAAKGVGHVNITFDNDGIVRRINLCFDSGERSWPHLAELIYRNGAAPSPAFAGLARCSQHLLLPYAPRDSYSEISFVDAHEGRIPDQLVKGRDIIIGATAAGMGDNYPAPFSDGGVVSGSEIMANVVAALRRDDFIASAPVWQISLFSLLPMWLLMLGFLRWQPRTALIVSLCLIATVLVAGMVALSASIWFPPGAALIGIILVYPLWGWRRLQAMSAFMQSELGELEREGEIVPLALNPDRGSDLVGRQSAALGSAIDHLRDLRRFVSDSLEHLPDPMFVTDMVGTVTMANHRIEDYLGPKLKGTALKSLLDRIVAPMHRRSVDEYLRAIEREPTGDHQPFVRFVSPDGSHFVMRSAPVVNDLDVHVGQIHYLADISALAQAESDREEALQLLSHDMRSPQSAIIALLPTVPDKDVSRRIEGHARRTIALAQDFVDVARMGESPFEGTDVLLTNLAHDVTDNFWPLAQERSVRIEVIDDSDSGFVLAEPDSLGRAIANILDNAIKFSPVGGSIQVRTRRIRDVEARMLELTICDEGPGIDPDLLPRLFTRFAARSVPDARIKSSGLGLTYVRAVAERHGGKVWVENGKKGACFHLRLPEAADPIPDPAA
ncbi:CHASE2 domain-containing protein [uncultured Sphingorhabdus sp.]|uniref:CHASE2 domain-containing protein n=1 Tax=uncultured Sphingorhabdus sp. TaxID=1686106 RepID=UPI00261E4E18|nr:CHASE2 domain-containing protein [uncultured Sphingorhabdus sp.]HMS21249.1 CHASE2 domain-containing protein [Sphingorhabdus sp.]